MKPTETLANCFQLSHDFLADNSIVERDCSLVLYNLNHLASGTIVFFAQYEDKQRGDDIMVTLNLLHIPGKEQVILAKTLRVNGQFLERWTNPSDIYNLVG